MKLSLSRERNANETTQTPWNKNFFNKTVQEKRAGGDCGIAKENN
jgi:hypothetical protein